MEGEARTWWVLRGQQRFGPYTRSELKSMAADGNVVASDYIWKDGLKEPMLASTISGLSFAAPPPPGSGGGSAGDYTNPYQVPGAADNGLPETINYSGEFGTEARHVPAGNGANWISDAWGIFKLSSGLMIGTFLLVMLMRGGIGQVPVIGSIVATLLSPFFVIGPMVLIHNLKHGQRAEISQLFDSFNTHLKPLLLLGLWQLGLWFGVVVLTGIVAVMLVGFSSLMSISNAGSNATQLAAAFSTVGVADILIVLFLFLVLAVLASSACVFSAPLVYFSGMPPVEAMYASYIATWRNWVPLLVSGIIGAILILLAIIPLGLGLLVWFPVMMISGYCSFVDMFGRQR